MFKVIEKFVSIDGEGPSSGELATFIRFCGCNLRCSWCDTTYSFEEDETTELMDVDSIYAYIKQSGVKNVTLTGGEPLIQKHIEVLLDKLSQDHDLVTRIETNGSVSIASLKNKYKNSNIHFILDYKLQDSKMSHKMCLDNLNCVEASDVYKFVISSMADLEQAKEIILKNQLHTKCSVYFSPVTNRIKVADIVEFMKEHKLNDVKLQLQLHKYIWPKDMRGV
ncbi:MAG TPA: putative 7-carboxy-7-deazaguanine synthase QueE [Firmicutes bacterium]|nr:putative 7-carboxy-7-deazaguanine synthase QueE [Bacillota bacterium]